MKDKMLVIGAVTLILTALIASSLFFGFPIRVGRTGELGCVMVTNNGGKVGMDVDTCEIFYDRAANCRYSNAPSSMLEPTTAGAYKGDSLTADPRTGIHLISCNYGNAPRMYFDWDYFNQIPCTSNSDCPTGDVCGDSGICEEAPNPAPACAYNTGAGWVAYQNELKCDSYKQGIACQPSPSYTINLDGECYGGGEFCQGMMGAYPWLVTGDWC